MLSLGVVFLNYLQAFGKPISCTQYLGFDSQPLQCQLSSQEPSQYNHTVIFVRGYTQSATHSFVKFTINTRSGKSFQTQASLGLDNNYELGLVKATTPNVLASPHLHQYENLPASQVSARFPDPQELFVTLLNPSSPERACYAQTFTSFQNLLNKPNLFTYLQYQLNARQCRLLVSPINYY